LANDSYIAAQGRKTGADGLVYCSIDGAGEVWVGGSVEMIAAGANCDAPFFRGEEPATAHADVA